MIINYQPLWCCITPVSHADTALPFSHHPRSRCAPAIVYHNCLTHPTINYFIACYLKSHKLSVPGGYYRLLMIDASEVNIDCTTIKPPPLAGRVSACLSLESPRLLAANVLKELSTPALRYMSLKYY
jgi:hypothetical protein